MAIGTSPATAEPVDSLSSLPREVLKWLQSLDLSYSVRNVKRDFANGFLIAEIFSRYHSQDISMHTFDNGLKEATRKDNWEQLFRFFRKQNYPISKGEFEPVMKNQHGAAIALLIKIYTLLTNRTVPVFMVEDLPEDAGSMSKKMAETLLEPPSSAPMEPAEEVREENHRQDAYQIFQAARQHKLVERSVPKAVAERGEAVPLDIPEVSARSLTRNVAQLRVQAQQVQAMQKSRNTTSMSQRKSTGNATDVGPTTPSIGFMGTGKPVVDVMRPIVAGVLQENDQVMKSLDPRKDVVVSFMELCRTHVPQPMCARAFQALTAQAHLLVEGIMKSPAEFWRVWKLLCPALVEFSERNPVFESVVGFFKRLGQLMSEEDPTLTQQFMMDGMLPSLAPLMVDTAGKREPLCEVVYSYAQPQVLSRLNVLRGLKEAMAKMPAYISCLSYFLPMEIQVGLQDEHLLRHYQYYALVALQCQEPAIRVGGLSMLAAVSKQSPAFAQNVLHEAHAFVNLVRDDWWEVQAQLMVLTGCLLELAGTRRDDAAQAETEAGESLEVDELAVEQLLNVARELMSGKGKSKLVLQICLCSLCKVLRAYPSLLPPYVNVLLQQPAAYRQRLLEPQAGTRRKRYTMGTSCRVYEECCILDWPSVEVARTLAEQAELQSLPHFEPEHLEVLTSCLPEPEVAIDDAWLGVFEKVKNYLFVASLDRMLHHAAVEVIRRFWLCRPQAAALKALDASKKTLLQTLRLHYSDAADEARPDRIDEKALIDFLREMKEAGGAVATMLQSVVDQFREVHNVEFQRSTLAKLFG
ncbi:unnamed protein product [Effrenium voratum]|uniref:Spermatogenesis-associated protein 4 n=1 Tax=Effrenium voratum TaxID=2562239 RepID=A0AA36J160_9DINO|nr:unnamed protein product [Effrenium voratum]